MRKHELADCENCPLFEDGMFCPSDGPEHADLVIVGEAPGKNEAKEGTPFIGASGQLLNMILEHVGHDRTDVFVTNTVLCRPPDNANPPTAAIKACQDRLIWEIRSRAPKTVVALGNFASKQLLATSEGITTLRVGPPKTSPRLGAGVRVIPTFHPAAALYNSGVFPDIVTDFKKIDAPDVSSSWEPPEYVAYDDHLAVDALKEILQKGFDPIAVDIEIGVDKDLSQVHPEQYRLLCVGLGIAPGKIVVIGENALQQSDVRHYLEILLTERRTIMHNGKFDLQGLWKIAPHARLWFDTMLASYTLDERRGTNSLEYNAIERLGSPSWKHVVGHYLGEEKDYSVIPREVLYRYNAFDVHNTYLLWQMFDEELTEELRGLHDHLVDASNMLMHVERNGLAVDQLYLDELTSEYMELLENQRTLLRGLVQDAVYNPNSWQQVQRVLKDIFDKRVPNTQAETLERVRDAAMRKGNKPLYTFLNLHLEYKKEAKSYGTYVKGTRKRLYRGRVHSTYMLHGTTTGRLSSRNPNLQNVTRGSRLRGLFIPRSDTSVLGQSDYRQAELRVVCTLARDTYLKSVFDDDSRSIHVEVAREFYGSDFDKVRDKADYVRAKAVVFGLTYGREAYSLAVEYEMSEAKAQAYIDKFFAMIPQVQDWRKDVIEAIHSGEDLVSVFGNHRRFWLITKNNKNNVEKEALAFYPQNTVSNLLLKAGIRLANEGMQDMLRVPIHDAWLFECDRDEADDVGEHVAKVMEEVALEYFTDYVRFPCDVGFGNTWGDIA